MSSPALVLAGKSPDAFRTISEVAADLDLPQHVLRFWESRFTQIKPVKRAGGRRYYRPEDVDLLRGIRALLHADGLTIRGAQKVLRERGWRHVAQIGRGDLSDRAPMAKAPEPVIVEKLVYIERPAAQKKRPSHLRAIPTSELPLFEVGSSQSKSVAIETRLAEEEWAKLQKMLQDLQQMKNRLREARKKLAI